MAIQTNAVRTALRVGQGDVASDADASSMGSSSSGRDHKIASMASIVMIPAITGRCSRYALSFGFVALNDRWTMYAMQIASTVTVVIDMFLDQHIS